MLFISQFSAHTAIVIAAVNNIQWWQAPRNRALEVDNRLVNVRPRRTHYCRLCSLSARTLYRATSSLSRLENTQSPLQRTWQQCDRQHIERFVVPRSIDAQICNDAVPLCLAHTWPRRLQTGVPRQEICEFVNERAYATTV